MCAYKSYIKWSKSSLKTKTDSSIQRTLSVRGYKNNRISRIQTVRLETRETLIIFLSKNVSILCSNSPNCFSKTILTRGLPTSLLDLTLAVWKKYSRDCYEFGPTACSWHLDQIFAARNRLKNREKTISVEGGGISQNGVVQSLKKIDFKQIWQCA